MKEGLPIVSWICGMKAVLLAAQSEQASAMQIDGEPIPVTVEEAIGFRIEL